MQEEENSQLTMVDEVCIEKREVELGAAMRNGTMLRRIKKGRVKEPKKVLIGDENRVTYHKDLFFKMFPNRPKNVDLSDLVEIRTGYSTDNLHKGSKKYKFQVAAPEDHCFSIIFNHKQYIHKSIDFAAPDKDTRDRWARALQQLLAIEREKRAVFNEQEWFAEQFRRADTNRNGQVSFPELFQRLTKLNLQLEEKHAKKIFQKLAPEGFLNEDKFIQYCTLLTTRPELQYVLSLYSNDDVKSWSVNELHAFLNKEQKFNVDLKKAEGILDLYEGTNQKGKEKVMGVIGLRRLLASRWGCIMKEGQEGVWQDMNQPLHSYFCNSSHNTYLRGLQIKGDATVEGYVAAINRGARLLELDLFDGEGGQPVITHKRTLIEPISLKDTLHAILKRAFVVSPFPLILTLENHVSIPQQKVMADLFQEILGDSLYIPDKDSGKRPLPSPNELRGKILLRGKKLDSEPDEEDDEEENGVNGVEEKSHNIDPSLSRLISLPSVKLTSNRSDDIRYHPQDGSASVSETKVDTMYENERTMASYTAKRFVKSYPKGLRQDSSNMFPMNSWLQGIQAAALNFQTPDEAFDVNQGLFRVNGNCGFVLKPPFLLDGHDPRSRFTTPKVIFGIGIHSGQYLPKSEPSRDIIDPFVTIQIYGMEKDECKEKTGYVKDNGFNPIWNYDFVTELYCPELAMVRFTVKDFDSTSKNDFVGEFSIPFINMREGYSQIRLNTGYLHTPDECASLFINVVIEEWSPSKRDQMFKKRSNR